MINSSDQLVLLSETPPATTGGVFLCRDLVDSAGALTVISGNTPDWSDYTMMGTTHALTGAAAWLAAAPHLFPNARPAELAAGAVIAAGFAVVPDLDHPDATAARRLGLVGKGLAHVVARVAGGHRQGTHSLFSVGVVSLLVWSLVKFASSPIPLAVLAAFGVFLGSGLLVRVVGGWASAGATVILGLAAGAAIYVDFVTPSIAALAVVLGYAMHLAGDAITTNGIALWWPVSSSRVGVPLMRTESATETVVRIGFLALTLWLAWSVLLDPAAAPAVLVANT